MRSALLLCSAALLTGGLVTAPAHAQGRTTGTFQACYTNKVMPGGVSVRLNLVVVAPEKTMSGEVRMSQAVNPPLNVTLPVKGSYTDRGGRHLAKLASPEMPGRRVTMALTISKNWKAATGAYTLWLDTPGGVKKGKLSLRGTPCQP